MSKYENSVFPYFVHSTVNLPALRPKDTNITMSFLRLFTETIILERKGFFSRNIVKIDENFSLSFRNFLLKYEPHINDKELHDKEQKIYTIFFHFYVLKELFSEIFNEKKILKKIMQNK